MASEDRRPADDSHPRMVECQKCSATFDWREDTCPKCGWDKEEWVENDRYGLENRDKDSWS